MSDREALKIFSRQPVSSEMIDFLAATISSIIQVKTTKPQYSVVPSGSTNMLVSPVKKNTSLVSFIKTLIKYSNVQTPTLMATVIYLNKLRNILPANAIGMETTRHRIFLASLILSAKSLNDSSPLNKHWTKYTDGLLSLQEVNMAERELVGLLKWNITIKEEELIIALQPFLTSIKQSLARKMEDESNQKISYYRLSNAYSNRSLASPVSPVGSASLYPPSPYSTHSMSPASRSSSSMSISSYNSTMSNSYSSNSLRTNATSNYSLSALAQEEEEYLNSTPTKSKRMPLSVKSSNSLNV
ncbi:cyclin, partial [Suhomyces tanzawaensis NRRL Y-17324]